MTIKNQIAEKFLCFLFLNRNSSPSSSSVRGKILSIVITAAIAMNLAGCGFRPLYGSHSDVQAELSGIDVGIIPDRTGQVLRQELQRRMLGSDPGPTVYDLAVTVVLHTDIAGIIATNSVASRERLSATANWTLRDAGTNAKVVAHGTANASDAENILNQQYFAADLETDAVNQRLMELLADQITTEVAAQLRGQQHG